MRYFPPLFHLSMDFRRGCLKRDALVPGRLHFVGVVGENRRNPQVEIQARHCFRFLIYEAELARVTSTSMRTPSLEYFRPSRQPSLESFRPSRQPSLESSRPYVTSTWVTLEVEATVQ